VSVTKFCRLLNYAHVLSHDLVRHVQSVVTSRLSGIRSQ
jgi:hypothetical protein